MITKIVIKNFKRLNAEIDLSQTAVFVGPNNSGKTSALQAIALWDIGLRKWVEAKKDSDSKKRRGVAVNRKDILSIPMRSAKHLWKNLHVQEAVKKDGVLHNKKIKIEIQVEGYTMRSEWKVAMEFDYANHEVVYARLLGSPESEVLQAALKEKIAFLPAMSGLAAREDMLTPGSIYSRIGEGRTADVLRNLCYMVYKDKRENWEKLKEIMNRLFGAKISEPEFDDVSGVINMEYNENGQFFDLPSAGRGFHQILLLFSFIFSSESTVLLVDEPDAHLEIIRQREVFNLLSSSLNDQNSQLIVATHSEAVLNEAAERDKIIAFIGNPHIVNNKAHLVKSLSEFGYDQYVQAEQKKCVLYLEGSTDLQLLQAFAKVLKHPAEKCLQNPFVRYVANRPSDARRHFHALREAFPNLKGVALFDRLNNQFERGPLLELTWSRYEIENYIPIPETIERYFSQPSENLFELHDVELIKKIMEEEIPKAALKDKTHAWWSDTKISEKFLKRIFEEYCKEMKMPVCLNKGDYYRLALLAQPTELDGEVKEKLDAIYNSIGKIS